MENIIKQELPSHILAKICWVGHRKGIVKDKENDLLCFENAYKDFLFTNTKIKSAVTKKEEKAQALIDAMNKLNTIYPVGRLTDCNAEDEALDGRIILGQTSIGTLKQKEENNESEL